ncbi:hypothetical protein [Brevibacillus laterosporus]|uniref:Uncharacterized protein n=1 Tax=Brevibacillus laterosporus TaxID=1465 RepID=A0AAP3DE99_BRELA|nr:hypothetical protein [Brevibacillus laterosporus]MCR8979508.1 hypothetical protein [Brevibacillus laterosporus]MCZ0806663.1 hypothetical protein [Brevibacillus laterosporus]MCZ0825111.1 hypothetical protein [Brevibacillus laterosporus]MCZ0852051.1 hypothetical protein [Brevibacillus laterosporus]
MNIQAVERMEGLIKEAREIVEKIEGLKEWVNNASNGSSTIEWDFEQLSNVYQAEVEAHMINAFIDVTKAEIKRLEKELAELWIWD